LTTTSEPINYTAASRTFDYASATTTDLGVYSYTLKVYFAELSTKEFTYTSADLTIEECCTPIISLNPSDLIVTMPYYLPGTYLQPVIPSVL
jgi:hypothetical protein